MRPPSPWPGALSQSRRAERNAGVSKQESARCQKLARSRRVTPCNSPRIAFAPPSGISGFDSANAEPVDALAALAVGTARSRRSACLSLARKWEVGETALKQATALVGRDPDAVCCPFRCPLASFVAARETRNLRTSDFLRLRDKDSNLDYLIQSHPPPVQAVPRRPLYRPVTPFVFTMYSSSAVVR